MLWARNSGTAVRDPPAVRREFGLTAAVPAEKSLRARQALGAIFWPSANGFGPISRLTASPALIDKEIALTNMAQFEK